MAAGVIIGRVAVKVIPDTADFKDALERDLNRIEKSLDSVKIEIEVDTDTVVQEAKQARQKAQDQMKDLRLKVNLDSEESIKRSLGQLNRELERLGEIDIDVDLNEDDLKAAMDLLSEQLDAVRTVKIDIDEADPASVRKAVDKINAELQQIKRVELEVALNEGTLEKTRDRLVKKMNESYREIRNTVQRQLVDIQIGMDVDPIKAARTIRKIEVLLEQIEDAKMTITPEMDERARFATLRKIQDMRDQVEDMKATIHPDLDAPLALALSARLAVLARDRFVEYIPRMNRAAAGLVSSALARMAGARLIGGYLQDIYRGIIQFDKAVPKVIALSLAVAGLGATGIAAASNLAALSASLASIAPAALALPGILGGFVVGIGVMIAALKDFNAVFPDVEKALSLMQDSISKNFWTEAKRDMRAMIDSVLPELRKGFDLTATSLGKFFANLAKATKTILVPELAGMFANLGRSIDIASNSARSIVGIITTLGTVGSSYLPRLAGWFVDVTKQFDEFLRRSEQTGEIYDWIDTGIEALKDLARVGANAALILYDIAQAAQAAGGSSLRTLADTLGRIRDITSSRAFQTGLTGVFEAAHDAISNIVAISGPALEQLVNDLAAVATELLPVAGAAIGLVVRGIATALTQPEVIDGIHTMFRGILDGISALTPAFEPLGRVLGTLGPLVGDLARNLGEVLGAAIPPVADALVRMGDAAAPLVPVLGQLLLDAVNALAPVVTNLGNAFVAIMEGGAIDIISAALKGFGDIILAIPTGVLTAIAGTLIAIAGAASLLSGALFIANLAVGAWNIVAGIAAGVTTAFGFAMAILTSPITLVILAIGALILAGYLLIKHWDVVKAAAIKVWNQIKAFLVSLWNNIKTVASGVWAQMKTAWQAFLNAVKQIASAIWTQIRRAWQDFVDALKAIGSAAWTAIRTAWQGFLNAVKEIGRAGMTALRGVWDAAWNGIKAFAQSAWTNIQTIVKTGIANAREAVRAGGNAIKEIAKAAWTATSEAFRTGVDRAVQFVRELPGKIKSGLGSLTGLLSGAGRDVIQGLINGINDMLGPAVQAAKNVASALAGAARSVLGIESPSKVFAAIGHFVGEGLADGIKASTGLVARSMKNLAGVVADTAIAPPEMPDIQVPSTSVRKGLVGSVRPAIDDSTGSAAGGKTFVYNAAPGSSLGAEEDLFAAVDRGRMVGW